MKTECPWVASFVYGTCPARCRVGEGLLPEHSVGMRAEERRRLMFNACMTTADHDRQGQAAQRQYKSRTVVEFALVSPCIIDTYKHEKHNFSVTYS